MLCSVNCMWRWGFFILQKFSKYQSTRLKITGESPSTLLWEHKFRENDYLRIPSSYRYLTMLSWQITCYFAFCAVPCTGVNHSVQLEAKPDTFPLRVLSWLEKTARVFRSRSVFHIRRNAAYGKENNADFSRTANCRTKFQQYLEAYLKLFAAFHKFHSFISTSARGTPTDILWKPSRNTLLWKKQEKRILDESGHDWFSWVSGV